MMGRFQSFTGPIRPEAEPVFVYNDGLTVFVYDAANESRLREANPSVLRDGCNAEVLSEPALRQLFDEARLLIYGQAGDAGIDVEVVVGAPLSDAECAKLRWHHEPERALLELPSGRLRIHSYNSLPIGDEDDPEEQGGMVSVEPGTYVVTVYAKDFQMMDELGGPTWDEAEASGEVDLYGDGDGKPLIREIIVLTPVSDAAPLADNPGVLFSDCIS